jgi:hypothetical protein
MKKLVYIAFVVLLGFAFGCHVSNYGVITDNNQSRGSGDGIVNTTGKAHIKESSQVATIWPDGSDETINFVDQAADGTAVLTTYNNFSTGNEPTFHDDLYCNPDWVGCSARTSADDNDANLFDYTHLNFNCSGARSICIVLSTGRYYGECGRRDARLTIAEKIAALSSAVPAQRFGSRGLTWELDSRNTTITARNLETGQTYLAPTYGLEIEQFVAENGNIAYTRLDHPMLGPALIGFASLLQDELKSGAIEVTVDVNGIDASFTVAGGRDAHVVRAFKENARRF